MRQITKVNKPKGNYCPINDENIKLFDDNLNDKNSINDDVIDKKY